MEIFEILTIIGNFVLMFISVIAAFKTNSDKKEIIEMKNKIIHNSGTMQNIKRGNVGGDDYSSQSQSS